MTDKKTTSTDEDRRLAREWAESVESYPDTWTDRLRAAARVILDAVPALPNLSDMSHVARRECQWMRCDVAGEDGEWLIIDPFDDESHAHVADRLGDTRVLPTHHVIPRPDLPRMEWTGSKKHEPSLPEGWRLADHPDHGRVIVTRPEPDDDGDVYFAFPADDLTGYDWDACRPDELTYLDTPEAVPPNTLAVGSVWIGVDALTRACEESGRDQIVVSDFGGYVSVWSHDAEWWEGSAPPRTTPYTIIHTGKEADQ